MLSWLCIGARHPIPFILTSTCFCTFQWIKININSQVHLENEEKLINKNRTISTFENY